MGLKIKAGILNQAAQTSASSTCRTRPMSQPNQTPQKAPLFRIGEIIDDSYQILEQLGSGAMGTVFRTRHMTLGSEYALKIITRAQLSDMDLLRFQHEAQALAKLNHPNIVSIYNCGLHKGKLPFYVLDFLKGQNLQDKIDDLGPQPLKDTLIIFMEACYGLAYAHSKGIVHRDVKPANIVILQKPDVHGARVKIVDFGIVRFLEGTTAQVQRLTSAGNVCGSPCYMSPEQASAREPDPRSDIYSLGCSLFEALTGNLPFMARSPVEVMLLHQNAIPPTLEEASGGLEFPVALQQLVDKMMAKNPDDRYQTMEMVALNLRNILRSVDPQFSVPKIAGRIMTIVNSVINTKPDNNASPQNQAGLRGLLSRRPLVTGALSIGIIATLAIPGYLKHKKYSTPTITENSPPARARKMQAMPSKGLADVSMIDHFSREYMENGARIIEFNFPDGDDITPCGTFFSSTFMVFQPKGKIKLHQEEKLSFIPTPIAKEQPEFFKKFREGEVTGLFIMANKDAEAVLAATSNIPGIEHLSVIGCRNLSSNALANLWKFDKLTRFAVSHSSLTGKDLAAQDEILRIKELFASEIKDISPLLKVLSCSPNLTTLDVSNCNLNESDYGNLTQIPRLKRLVIDGNHIDEKGLELLAQKTPLETLSLKRSSIKGNLSKSFGKFKNLKILTLTKGYVPISQINLLQKEHPKLTVIAE